MTDALIYQLLKIIKHNGNILQIFEQGFSFGQINNFSEILKMKDYIFVDLSGRTLLTSVGEAFIVDFEANEGIAQYSRWILPRNEMWFKPISINSIYIPKE